tara:strand:+ start:1135 stop:1566 length:432 start_codon:yes stop_codon:yes gene_type:complete
MSHQKLRNKIMQNKTIGKGSFSINKLIENLKFFPTRSEESQGILYTLFMDKYNYLEVGFAKDKKEFESKLLESKLILLDKKEGNAFDLYLLKKTLKEIGLETVNNKYYLYSEITMRHLCVLGWPIGKSLYKTRKIKKELSYIY